MNSIKYFFVFLFLLGIKMGYCQNNIMLSKELQRYFLTMELSRLIFFPGEIVALSTDSSFVENFKKKLKIKFESFNKLSNEDKLENQLVMQMLYDTLSSRANTNGSKEVLINIFKPYIINKVKIDEDFILHQLDSEKRSLKNGYDAGVTSESRFVFFLNDPLLLKRVLLKNNLKEKWLKTGVFLCNYLRSDEISLKIKFSIFDQIREKISSNPNLKDISEDFNNCQIDKKREQ